MNNSIAAIVVTYNRKELLMECLAALIGQSQHLDIIYIIDNASTDGTPDLLRERQFMNHPRISYHRMPTNGGGGQVVSGAAWKLHIRTAMTGSG